MKRLTIVVDNGFDEVCFEVPSDKEGMYSILDISRYSDDGEMQEILLNVAGKLAEYEDTGFEPEDILSNIKTLSNELNSVLEKQSSKTLEHRVGFRGMAEHWVCPNCGRIYWFKEYIENYCGSCGQKLTVD